MDIRTSGQSPADGQPQVPADHWYQLLLGWEDKTLFHFFQLTFYYGKRDGWCPIKYYEDMKKDFPEGNIYLCEKGIPHAFVLGFNQEMATMVADWINNRLPEK